MKSSNSYFLLLPLLISILCIAPYTSQAQLIDPKGTAVEPETIQFFPPVIKNQLSDYDYGKAFLKRTPPISEFVRRILHDTNGNLWFGTNGDGVARYDGDALEYFSASKGLGGGAVRGIVEDKEGNVWFGTSGGLIKFDGKLFINITQNDGLISNNIWSITIDNSGTIWRGTSQGISFATMEKHSPRSPSQNLNPTTEEVSPAPG